MASVVFLRGINVGGASLCKPAAVANQLSKFDIVNIGAAGTFVVRKNVSDSILRAAIAKKLPIKCEIMICQAKALLDVVRKDPFARHPSGPEFTRFMSVLHKAPASAPPLPRCLPSPDDWLLKIIAIPDRFVIGIYRREMKAISYLGKIEKILGTPGTVRNWNTVQKIVKILEANPSD